MDWIEPLKMETWIINVFSGTPEIFAAISLIAIASLAGFFRMNILSMFLMIGIFVLMFSGFIGASLMTLMITVGGAIVGFSIARLLSLR